MKIASRSINLISKKTNLHVPHTFFSYQQKNKFARAARFFVFLCRCFARLQRRFVRLKHQTLQKSYKIFLWSNCRTGMCLPKILFPVFMFAFIFSLPLIFTLLAASIFSFSHRRYEIFMFFFPRNSSPLFSVTRSLSFSVIHVSVNVKNNVEKDTTLLLLFSLSL